MKNQEILSKAMLLPQDVLSEAFDILYGGSKKMFPTTYKATEMLSVLRGGSEPCLPFLRFVDCFEYLKQAVSPNIWVVYIEDRGFEGVVTIKGVVNDLESFKKMAKEIYGELGEPKENEYGTGSLHYEYSVKKSEKYSEYFHLVAEPKEMII